MKQKILTWLKAVIIIATITLVILAVTVLPGILKESHARNVADRQTEYMQSELKKGTSPAKVAAKTQANLTEEMSDNEEFRYTIYSIDINEESKTCKINVTIADGDKIKNFSSKPLNY